MKRINRILIAAMVLVMVAMFANANIPPAPAELNNDTGNYWVNYTWSKDTDHPDNDNVTDSFNVSMNGTWYNGTATFLNESVGPGGRANIMVWAYNRTGNGNMSMGRVSDSVQAPAVEPEPEPEPTPTPTVLTCDCGDICVNTSGWWRDGGEFNANATTPIQAAVDAAEEGETIHIAAGTYDENVDIETSHLTLVGEGADVVNVGANSASDHVFEVTEDYVNISGFTLTGATGYGNAGIHLNSGQNCNISDNTASHNYYGIRLCSSSNNALANNRMSGNNNGIWLGYSSNNTLANNNASDNSYSICLRHSSNNTLANNNASDNSYGICLWHSSNNTLTSNTANSNNYYGIYLRYSSNNTLTGNTANSNNDYGIWLCRSSNNTLTGNTANSNNDDGIMLCRSNDNTLTSNTASNNDDGIYIRYSNDNTLANNTMSGNDYNFGVDGYSLSHYTQTIYSNNTVDGKPIYYYVDQQGGQIPTDAGYVGVVSSTNIIVRDLNLAKNLQGILFVNTSDSTIENVTASNNNYCGIALGYSSNDNTLTSNTASGNVFGIALVDASNNNTLTSNTASNNDYGIWLGTAGVPAEGANNATSNNFGCRSPVSSNDTLTDNDTSDNGYGIVLDVGGEMVEGANNNTLTSNNASGNYYGIYLTSSNNNTITSNTANSNIAAPVLPAKGGPRGSGIWLGYSSNNNTLASNTASNNSDWDIWIVESLSNTFADNTLNGTTVSFTYSGDVSLRGVGLPAAGAPWYSIGKFINATSHSEGAWMILNFSYSDSDFTGAMDESNLTVWKYNGTWYEDGWNGTRYSDPVNNIVGVNITCFSVFAPMTTGVPALDHLTVEPGSVLLNIDEPQNKSQIFTATGRSKHTDPIPDLMFGWSNSDTSVGGLNSSVGTVVNFTAERAGRAYLTASNGSVTSDQAQVTVDAIADNADVTDGAATVTSGDATVTCDLGAGVNGWINITAIGNATNSPEVNSSDPRFGLGDGDKGVSGVTVNVSENILAAMENGSTIRIQICYNATTLTALGIDASTLAIWKYDNDTEKWVKQPSTRSGTCVYVDVSHLCTYGLVGSTATSGGDSSGGEGTYPPGWFGTPTVTATKAPAATTTGTATDAPPGDKVTPVPAKAKPAAAKVTAEGAKKGAPGFTAVFVIAGMLAVAYAMMRRRE